MHIIDIAHLTCTEVQLFVFGSREQRQGADGWIAQLHSKLLTA